VPPAAGPVKFVQEADNLLPQWVLPASPPRGFGSETIRDTNSSFTKPFRPFKQKLSRVGLVSEEDQP
jgi:hypothetical protein